MKKNIFLVTIFSVLFFSSCSEFKSEGNANPRQARVANKSFTILNWNAQTFFDSVTDGNEYSEFQKAKNWDFQKYTTRLERLCSVIQKSGADIIVLEELEKQEQLVDITNALCASQISFYKYGVFATNPGSSIGCAILSRFQIADLFLHNVDYRSLDKKTQPSMRPIMEATILTNNSSSDALKLFVNHWKSKSGGAEESEIWRDKQEQLLAHLIKTQKQNGIPVIVACGDFNRDIQEFEYAYENTKSEKFFAANDGGNIKLGKTKTQNSFSDEILVESPWFSQDGTLYETGSYRYNDEWERIDNFFICGKCEFVKFEPFTCGDWADENDYPKRYEIYNGKGYSDHLPIFAEIGY